MLRGAWCRYRLAFKFTARTSRETMTVKDTYYIKLWHDGAPERYGIGEAALFRGLSADDRPGYETMLARYCNDPAATDIADWPSIVMGAETALADLANGGMRRPFPGAWSEGRGAIIINGLVWMGNAGEMLRRIDAKLAAGFRCLKMKIGGVDFDEEIRLLRHVRDAFGPDRLMLRLDANGAFTPANAMERLERLAAFDIHSIEQPIRAGQWDEMARLCHTSPIPIALDEEIIGHTADDGKERLLDAIAPAYIILKPTLCGGFAEAERWIGCAGDRGIGYWVTSALESDIGLNAIAQWTSRLGVTTPQGLGTGELYHNNIPSPLTLDGDRLRLDPSRPWIIPALPWSN